MSPVASPTPPTANPTVETVANEWSESMSGWDSIGQFAFGLHALSRVDRLPSARAPKMDPRAMPAPPTPIRTNPSVFEDPFCSGPPAAGGGPLMGGGGSYP